MINSNPKQTIILSRAGYAGLLAEEISQRWAIDGKVIHKAAVAYNRLSQIPPVSATIFGRQVLPQAMPLSPVGLEQAVRLISERLEIADRRPNRRAGSWTLHTFGVDDDTSVQFAGKLERALLFHLQTTLPKFYRRYLPAAHFKKIKPNSADICVQIFVQEPQLLWLSIATFASGVSTSIAGVCRLRANSAAPSRSARKLEEAFLVMGQKPQLDDSAVDLGAAPGGWTFTLAKHGANVTAVDHGGLDLPESAAIRNRVRHLKANGLQFQTDTAVAWLCCDMLVNPRETLRILERWLSRDLMQHFIVNLKLPQDNPWPVISDALVMMNQIGWPVAMVKHLYHDRREVTLLGSKLRPVSLN